MKVPFTKMKHIAARHSYSSPSDKRSKNNISIEKMLPLIPIHSTKDANPQSQTDCRKIFQEIQVPFSLFLQRNPISKKIPRISSPQAAINCIP